MQTLIGVTCAYSPETRMRDTHRPFHFVECAYSEALHREGALAVLMVPPAGDAAALDACARAMLRRVDGLYFCGGAGGGSHMLTGEKRPLYEQQPLRSAWEDALLRAAWEQDIPVLGVCRGHQMITVALGGTLDREYYPAHRQTLAYHEPWHTVYIEPGSLLADVAGPEPWPVNSLHTQRVETPPPGFIVSARTADGSVEAVEAVDKTFFLGTQFHPELMPDDPRAQKVLAAFVAACRRRAGE